MLAKIPINCVDSSFKFEFNWQVSNSYRSRTSKKFGLSYVILGKLTCYLASCQWCQRQGAIRSHPKEKKSILFQIIRRKFRPTKQTIKIKSVDYFLIVLVKSNFGLGSLPLSFPVTVTLKLQNPKLQVSFPFHYFTLA